MNVRLCVCGAKPLPVITKQVGMAVVQLRCACGPKGARLLCYNLGQLERARQAVVDGGNLAQ